MMKNMHNRIKIPLLFKEGSRRGGGYNTCNTTPPVQRTATPPRRGGESNYNRIYFPPTLYKLLAITLLLLLITGCSPVKSQAGRTAASLPDGFTIAVYADDLPSARSLALGTNGTLFVGSRRSDKVYAVVDEDGDYKADKKYLIAKGLKTPSGIAFKDGSLYIAEISRITRYNDIENHLDTPPDPVVIRDDLPKDRHHGWKYIAFGPDGKLYIPIGAPCNVCERTDDERYASMCRMDADGQNFEVYAKGIRNSVGFTWHPETDELWFTDNGRDWLGDDLPPDELNRAPEKGMHFGFPYCHGGTIPDPELAKGKKCEEFTPPVQPLGPHVAALGVKFYTGTQFPKKYQGDIFIAEHGSWNRSEPIGYRIMRVKLDGNKAVKYEVFMDGWHNGDKPSGRPVDLLVMPDGSMLVSDDYGDKVWRISYR